MRRHRWRLRALSAAICCAALGSVSAQAASFAFDLDAPTNRVTSFDIKQTPDSGHAGGRIRFTEMRGDKTSDAFFAVNIRNAMGRNVVLRFSPFDKGRKLKVEIHPDSPLRTDIFEATYPVEADAEIPVSIDWDAHAVITLRLPDGASRKIDMAGAYSMTLGAGSADVACADWSVAPVATSDEGKNP